MSEHKESNTADIDAMIADLGVEDLKEGEEVVEQAHYNSNPHTDRVRQSVAKVVYKSQYPLMVVAYANDTALADPALFALLRGELTPESTAAGERAYHFLESLFIRAKNIKLAGQAQGILTRPAGDKTPHLKCHFFWAAMVMSATWRGVMPEWLPEHFAEDLFEKDGTPKEFVPYDDVREQDVEICHKLIDYLLGQFQPRQQMGMLSKKKLRKLQGM